ncbi:MAG: glycosyltransferase family 2 protein [bacterium]|nr:glycosyltransferase family 2 protein [bacterium]
MTEPEKYFPRERITAVICARDEEQSIGQIIQATLPHVSQVIVVDGNSRDKTSTIARSLGALILTDNGLGKGDAIRCAIPQISTDITVFLDADGSHDPQDIPLVCQPILENRAEHVTASRLIGGSSELHGGFDEFFRLAGSSFITACINTRFGVKLSDSQNGFRAIKTSVLRSLNLQENLTTIEQEMIMKTLRAGYPMTEVPSHEHRRWYGKSHINVFKVSHRYIWTLIKYCYLR